MQVHFECKYRGLTVVSTLMARTLGGNRTVSEVGAGAGPCSAPARWRHVELVVQGTPKCCGLRLPAHTGPTSRSQPGRAPSHVWCPCPPTGPQAFEFTAGQPVSGPSARMVESAGGLYAGGGGPKPPPALSQAVVGMRAGGKRSVLVPAELGYGSQGEQEIPPNCEQFELQVGPGGGCTGEGQH